jgi:hypothetical protein
VVQAIGFSMDTIGRKSLQIHGRIYTFLPSTIAVQALLPEIINEGAASATAHCGAFHMTLQEVLNESET